MPDRRGRSRADRRRQRRREDEAGRVGAHGVDQIGVGRNIAAETAESLRELTFDNVNPVHHAIALGDAAAMGTIHSDSMNLVDVSQRAIPFREIADLMQRRYIPSME
jgi:hypothetical protein